MQKQPTTLIRVHVKSAERLVKLYGKPQWIALDRALKQAPCEHPEDGREYLSAEIPNNGAEAINQNEQTITIHGFHCEACGRYVFQDTRAEE